MKSGVPGPTALILRSVKPRLKRKRSSLFMRTLGRGLQIFALVLLPLSMLMQVSNVLGRQLHVSEMVIMLVAGIAAFMLGRLIEGYAPQ